MLSVGGDINEESAEESTKTSNNCIKHAVNVQHSYKLCQIWLSRECNFRAHMV